jgi:undecaprenyl pyrophosphate phosphatase UppP
MKMTKEIKKKIRLDLKLLLIAIPSFIIGFLCSPFVETPLFDINPFISGICGAPAFLIIPYLIISWLFYKEIKNFKK